MDEDLINKCRYKKSSLCDKHIFTTPEVIESLDQFNSLLDVCEYAHEDEVIVLNILCYGGSVDVTLAVYNALRSTKATVSTINKSVAASGGSILLLAGDNIGYNRNSYTMVHTSSYSTGFNTNPENFNSALNSEQRIRDIYHDVYQGFLTEQEIEDVLKGTPIYILDKAHDDRLKRLMDLREKEYEKYTSHFSQDELLKKSKKDLVDIILGNNKEE